MESAVTQHSFVQLCIEVAQIIGKAHEDPNFDNNGSKALELYRKVFAIAKQWLPVLEGLLHDHGAERQARTGNEDRNVGSSESSSHGKRRLLSLVFKILKLGNRIFIQREGGGSWKLALLREMHQATGQFIQEAERGIRRLEGTGEGKKGRGQRLLQDGTSNPGRGFSEGTSRNRSTSLPHGRYMRSPIPAVMPRGRYMSPSSRPIPRPDSSRPMPRPHRLPRQESSGTNHAGVRLPVAEKYARDPSVRSYRPRPGSARFSDQKEASGLVAAEQGTPALGGVYEKTNTKHVSSMGGRADYHSTPQVPRTGSEGTKPGLIPQESLRTASSSQGSHGKAPQATKQGRSSDRVQDHHLPSAPAASTPRSDVGKPSAKSRSDSITPSQSNSQAPTVQSVPNERVFTRGPDQTSYHGKSQLPAVHHSASSHGQAPQASTRGRSSDRQQNHHLSTASGVPTPSSGGDKPSGRSRSDSITPSQSASQAPTVQSVRHEERHAQGSDQTTYQGKSRSTVIHHPASPATYAPCDNGTGTAESSPSGAPRSNAGSIQTRVTRAPTVASSTRSSQATLRQRDVPIVNIGPSSVGASGKHAAGLPAKQGSEYNDGSIRGPKLRSFNTTIAGSESSRRTSHTSLHSRAATSQPAEDTVPPYGHNPSVGGHSLSAASPAGPPMPSVLSGMPGSMESSKSKSRLSMNPESSYETAIRHSPTTEPVSVPNMSPATPGTYSMHGGSRRGPPTATGSLKSSRTGTDRHDRAHDPDEIQSSHSRMAPSQAASQVPSSYTLPHHSGSARAKSSTHAASHAGSNSTQNKNDLFSDASSMAYQGLKSAPRRKKCHHDPDDGVDPAYCPSEASTNSS